MTTLAPAPLASRGAQANPLPRVDPITRLPLLVLLPHSHCNCRCLMCDIWRSDAREQIPPETVARRLTEWRTLGVERVMLSGGEPLMHSRLWELCAHLKGAGIGVTLLSTGLLLKRHAQQLIEYCDDVIVSLDGPPATHDAIRRVPRAYERLAQGLRAVADAAREHRQTITLSARCTVQRANYRQLRAVVRTAGELPLARISFLAADVSSTAFNHPPGGLSPGEIALRAEDLPLLVHELAQLERECAGSFRSGFIAESPAKLSRRLYQYYAALVGQGDFPTNRCNAPWVSAVLDTDGTVRPCFFQPPLGKLTPTVSLSSIINSAHARRWRAGLDIARDSICRRCVCTLSLSTDAGPSSALPA